MRDRQRNESIRERMEVVNIGVKSRRAGRRWYGHVRRRDEGYVRRRIMGMVAPGRGGRGRPKQWWMDNIKVDMRSVGAQEEDAEDRNTWRALVSAAATPY